MSYLAITICLAGLDHLVARAEELKAVLFASIRHISDLQKKIIIIKGK